MQLDESRSGSSLSLQRQMQAPSHATNGAGGVSQSGGTGDASRVHRSASSANPAIAPIQKPSRRYSQDTHTTGAHASATASSGASGMFDHSQHLFWLTTHQISC